MKKKDLGWLRRYGNMMPSKSSLVSLLGFEFNQPSLRHPSNWELRPHCANSDPPQTPVWHSDGHFVHLAREAPPEGHTWGKISPSRFVRRFWNACVYGGIIPGICYQLALVSAEGLQADQNIEIAKLETWPQIQSYPGYTGACTSSNRVPLDPQLWKKVLAKMLPWLEKRNIVFEARKTWFWCPVRPSRTLFKVSNQTWMFRIDVWHVHSTKCLQLNLCTTVHTYYNLTTREVTYGDQLIPINLSTLLHLEKLAIRGTVYLPANGWTMRTSIPAIAKLLKTSSSLKRVLLVLLCPIANPQIHPSVRPGRLLSASLPNPPFHRSDFISNPTKSSNCADLMKLVDKGLRLVITPVYPNSKGKFLFVIATEFNVSLTLADARQTKKWSSPLRLSIYYKVSAPCRLRRDWLPWLGTCTTLDGGAPLVVVVRVVLTFLLPFRHDIRQGPPHNWRNI